MTKKRKKKQYICGGVHFNPEDASRCPAGHGEAWPKNLYIPRNK